MKEVDRMLRFANRTYNQFHLKGFASTIQVVSRTFFIFRWYYFPI